MASVECVFTKFLVPRTISYLCLWENYTTHLLNPTIYSE